MQAASQGAFGKNVPSFLGSKQISLTKMHGYNLSAWSPETRRTQPARGQGFREAAVEATLCCAAGTSLGRIRMKYNSDVPTDLPCLCWKAFQVHILRNNKCKLHTFYFLSA